MHVKPNHPSQTAAGSTLIGFNLIHGREVEGDLGLIESRSPVDSRDVVGLFPDSGAKDVERAAKAAADAFPGWARLSWGSRCAVARRLGEGLETQLQRLSRILTREAGLVPTEAAAEVRLVIDGCRLLAERKEPLGRPCGVIGMLSSRTSPLATPLRRILAAIATGNTVVWKPSDGAPTVAYLAMQALHDAGLPAGVVNTVNGKGRGGCGKHFLAGVEKGLFQKFSYSGGSILGRQVGEVCGRSLVPVELEVGGRGCLIVMADADLDLAVEAALADAFRAAGQHAAALGNILLHRPIAARFEELFVAAAASLKVGNPVSHPEVAYGPLLNERFAAGLRGHCESGAQEGARLRLGGLRWDDSNRTELVAGEIAKGAYVQPCVWTDVAPAMALFRDSVPGPTVNLCSVDSFEEALAIANSGHSLACSLFTGDRDRALAFRSAVRAPLAALNAPMPLAFPIDPGSWGRPQALEAVWHGSLDTETPDEAPPPPAKPCVWEVLD